VSSEQSPIFFPQGFLIWQQAYASLQSKLQESRIESQNPENAKVAKLKGSYQPETVVSKFVTTDGTRINNHLLNLENHKISSLVPEVRLFRVVENESGKNRVVPFYFPVASEFDFAPDGTLNLEKSSFSAGAAAIERFEISLNGKNPYQVTRKFLNASLSIKVDNISVLFDRKEGYAMLADLFTIRAGAKNSEIVGFNKSQSSSALANGQSCRVVATLGYCVPRNYELFTQEEIITIEQSKTMINLYYSGHDLQLSQDGSATINVKYTGYLESIKDQSNFDLFTNSKTKAWQNRRATKSKEIAGEIKIMLFIILLLVICWMLILKK
jgi:hypothetical protein